MQAKINEGCFIETVSMFGHWYGYSFDSVYRVAMDGKICLMDLELDVRIATSFFLLIVRV
jgi:guanylate kinase